MKQSEFRDIDLSALRRPLDRTKLCMLLARLLSLTALVRFLIEDSTPASSPPQRTEDT